MPTGEQQSKVSPELQRWAQEKGQQAAEKFAAISDANTDPLPGPLYDAFCRGAIKVRDGLLVRKVVARDWIILRGIDSPFLKLIREWQEEQTKPEAERKPAAEVDVKESDQWVLCWMFTRPVQMVRDVFESQGADAIKKAAESVGDELSASEVNIVVTCVLEQVRRSWLTALKYSADLGDKGEVSFFQDAGASQKTASAGGSTT